MAIEEAFAVFVADITTLNGVILVGTLVVTAGGLIVGFDSVFYDQFALVVFLFPDFRTGCFGRFFRRPLDVVRVGQVVRGIRARLAVFIIMPSYFCFAEPPAITSRSVIAGIVDVSVGRDEECYKKIGVVIEATSILADRHSEGIRTDAATQMAYSCCSYPVIEDGIQYFARYGFICRMAFTRDKGS
ncbi:hypothetical protein [Candidatus Poriferisodalis sp.]|uniref:hypothetical protein n=1 Tax=Candidatus Poriferisodalis sp. TaxID=3101277 RepID=UPI003B02BFBE